MVDNNILYGVGKTLRARYLASKISEKEVMNTFLRNKKEADACDFFGWTIFELIQEEKRTHNPLLRQKLNHAIIQHKEKSRNSLKQNELSLAKLDFYRESALGIGIRPVMHALRTLAKAGNINAEICLMLMQIEFANLNAKKLHHKKDEIYKRKDYLLMTVSDLLYDNGWTCGISSNTGKNASYIVYVYLPNGSQLCWHCNNYRMLYYYDDITCDWDGLICSTLEKLLCFVHDYFGIGTLIEYAAA